MDEMNEVERDTLMVLANETMAAFMSDEDSHQDRKLFVHNLGRLMSQTREGISHAYLDDEELVHVVWKNGYEQVVNVHMDSYFAIIRDVVKNVEL